MLYFMNLIGLLLSLQCSASTLSIPRRDLVLPGLDGSNELVVRCGTKSSPAVTFHSCYGAWRKMLDDLPEGNLHLLGRHVRPLGPPGTM